eukprot:PLAT7087.1.p1 GENE.PLAT7087.1~~PLAT7087.1.p1  ORF type:complete len:908 (+),score=384.60 PLAT7087.1:1009-3732(+)
MTERGALFLDSLVRKASTAGSEESFLADYIAAESAKAAEVALQQLLALLRGGGSHTRWQKTIEAMERRWAATQEGVEEGGKEEEAGRGAGKLHLTRSEVATILAGCILVPKVMTGWLKRPMGRFVLPRMLTRTPPPFELCSIAIKAKGEFAAAVERAGLISAAVDAIPHSEIAVICIINATEVPELVRPMLRLGVLRQLVEKISIGGPRERVERAAAAVLQLSAHITTEQLCSACEVAGARLTQLARELRRRSSNVAARLWLLWLSNCSGEQLQRMDEEFRIVRAVHFLVMYKDAWPLGWQAALCLVRHDCMLRPLCAFCPQLAEHLDTHAYVQKAAVQFLAATAMSQSAERVVLRDALLEALPLTTLLGYIGGKLQRALSATAASYAANLAIADADGVVQGLPLVLDKLRAMLIAMQSGGGKDGTAARATCRHLCRYLFALSARHADAFVEVDNCLTSLLHSLTTMLASDELKGVAEVMAGATSIAGALANCARGGQGKALLEGGALPVLVLASSAHHKALHDQGVRALRALGLTELAYEEQPWEVAAALSQFEKLLDGGDMWLRGSDGSVRAHRALLAAGCLLLSELFDEQSADAEDAVELGMALGDAGDESELVVQVDDTAVSVATIRAWLLWLYTGQLPAESDVMRLEALAAVAEEYALPALTRAVERSVKAKALPAAKPAAAAERSVQLPFAYRALLSDARFTDVTLQAADGREVKAHRAVIAARCPYIAALDGSGMRDAAGAVVVMDVGFGALQLLLRWLYTGQLQVDGEMDEDGGGEVLIDLLAASSRYLLSGLHREVERMLWEAMDDANALTLLQIADAYAAPRLRVIASSWLHWLLVRDEALADGESSERGEEWRAEAEAALAALPSALQHAAAVAAAAALSKRVKRSVKGDFVVEDE